MFAFIAHSLGDMIASAKARQHDAYLASSADLADLERRMRRLDDRDRAFGMRLSGAIRTDRRTAVSNF